ncbi:hypothetical protein BIW22_20680 [Salmonella enterica]|nr:hypothetical protein [Salmonella enterica]
MVTSDAPVTTGERLEWMAVHCDRFEFQMNKQGYFIVAHKGSEKYYESAGPLADVHEAVDDAFYEVIQR